MITCKPEQCRRCGGPLTGSDPEPVAAASGGASPVYVRSITEYQLHRLMVCGLWDHDVWGITCRVCGHVLWAALSQYRGVVYGWLSDEQADGGEFLS